MALQQLKLKLANLRADSWHRRLVDFAFFGKLKPKKACPYWWFIVPSAPLVAGLKLIVILIGGLVLLAFGICIGILGEILAHLILLITWLGGYRLRNGYVEDVLKFHLLNDHGYKFVKTKSRIKPYHILLTVVFVGGITLMSSTSWPWLPTVLLLTGLAVLVVFTLGLLYTRIVHPIVRRFCPEIVWTKPNTSE